MKYVAFPINKDKGSIKSDDYEHLLEMAKTALIQDPAIRGYHIMEHVVTLTTKVSVAVQCHNNTEMSQSNEVESLFDPKPDDIPEPPEEFVYYGKKLVPCDTYDDDIAFLSFDGTRWIVGGYGSTPGMHYAIRAESQTFYRAERQARENKAPN